jgi:4'-phosphopantetheinyl transferase
MICRNVDFLVGTLDLGIEAKWRHRELGEQFGQSARFPQAGSMAAEMKEMIEWSSPSTTPVLACGEVHVWRASLSGDLPASRCFAPTLSADEQARAARFIFERDRDHYISARGILRDLLGRYMKFAPQMIKFEYGPHGKPAIACANSKPAISFNLSHSHGLAMVAIAHKREVGIDVELIRPDFAGEQIAKRYFSGTEVAELNALPTQQRAESFFLCWTRKEAYIKARGDGLHTPLDSFSVSLSPDNPATLTSADESRWGMESFVPSLAREPRYVATVVAEGKNWKPRYFGWKSMPRIRQEEREPESSKDVER